MSKTADLERVSFLSKAAATDTFTKRDTDIVKGLAVCLLLIHHLYMGVLPAPISLLGNPPTAVFATLSKVCVAIFTLLSGYGLTLSYAKSGTKPLRFTLRHVLGLMKPFWVIFAIFFISGTFLCRDGFTPAQCYDDGFGGLCNVLADFFALRPLLGTGTMNQTWWYMEAALVLYVFFVPIRFLVKKVPYIALPIFSLPLLWYFIRGNNVWDTCREIYWFFPFAVGIFAAQHDLLTKFCNWVKKFPCRMLLLSFALLTVCAVIRAKLGLAFDTFFALSVILFMRASLCRIPYVSSALALAGKCSADIFMSHSFFYCYFISQKLFLKLLWSANPLVQLMAFFLLLGVSMAFSLVLTQLKKLLAPKKNTDK